jgi:hypothetical protein
MSILLVTPEFVFEKTVDERIVFLGKPDIVFLIGIRFPDHVHVKDMRWRGLALRIELDDYVNLLVKSGCFYRLEL